MTIRKGSPEDLAVALRHSRPEWATPIATGFHLRRVNPMESGPPHNPEDPGPPDEQPAPESQPVIPPALMPQEGGYAGYAQPGFNAPTNYPRYYPTNGGPVPPGPPVIRFGAIGDAWNLIQEDFGI